MKTPFPTDRDLTIHWTLTPEDRLNSKDLLTMAGKSWGNFIIMSSGIDDLDSAAAKVELVLKYAPDLDPSLYPPL